MSAVWEFFSVETGSSKNARCKICNASISRGGTTSKDFNTSNLIKHLKRNHVKEHSDFVQASTKKQASTGQQQSLEGAFHRRDKYPPDSVKAKAITEKLVEFVALDDQPLSVVDKIGFRRLIEHLEPRYNLPNRRYLTETALPQLYARVYEHVKESLKDVPVVSFTSDIWSSDVCPMTLLSLTASWVDTDFTLKSAVLQAKPFRGSHTAEAIAATFEDMLKEWNIPKNRVHVVLRDNAKNMVKAMKDLGLPSLGCAAHSLNLVVHEGLLSQRTICDALASGRKIVGHFKHSPLAYSRLEDIQADMNLPVKRLQQDVHTRWNSTFYMVQSLIEQKRPLCAYAADHDLPATLTANQWGLLEKTLAVLEPFEELTRELSSSSASAADVIPAVTVLRRLLHKETEADQGIKTMKSTLLDAVNSRFSTVEEEPLYSVATLLDPRYKDRSVFTKFCSHRLFLPSI